MRTCLIILLLIPATQAFAGQSPSTGTLEVKLSRDGKPFAKRTIHVWVESSIGIPNPFSTQLTTDDSGSMRLNLVPIPGTYKIHLAAKEIDEHSFDATIKGGETSTVEVVLDPVEEIEFVRLPKEEIAKMQDACQRAEFWRLKVPSTFDNEQQWKDSWSAFKLEAPEVNFKKWRVLAFVVLSNYVQPPRWVDRVTYNPKNKVIRARMNHIEVGNIQSPAFSCRADFVLIPARDAHVEFR